MKISPVLLSLALALTPLGVQAETKVVNRSIATVNGDPILMSEFEKNLAAFQEQMKNLGPDAPQLPPEKAREKLLQQMVDDRLLLQEAKKQKIKPTQRELENGLAQVKARFLSEEAQKALKALLDRSPETANPDSDMPDVGTAWKTLSTQHPEWTKNAEAKFREELAKEGLTEKKHEEKIADQLSIAQLSSKIVRERATPPAAGATRTLFDNITQVMKGDKPKGLSEEEEKDLQGLAQYFQEQTGERVRARHILIRVAEKASLQDKSAARLKLEGLAKQIKDGADFAELAQKFSDDKASAERGGDLGFFVRQQMVPAFEKAAFSLPVGGTSEIVETPFGYHLIQVEEKKAARKLKFEDVQDDLKEYLSRAGMQKQYELYIENLRKQADIKISLGL